MVHTVASLYVCLQKHLHGKENQLQHVRFRPWRLARTRLPAAVDSLCHDAMHALRRTLFCMHGWHLPCAPPPRLAHPLQAFVGSSVAELTDVEDCKPSYVGHTPPAALPPAPSQRKPKAADPLSEEAEDALSALAGVWCLDVLLLGGDAGRCIVGGRLSPPARTLIPASASISSSAALHGL